MRRVEAPRGTRALMVEEGCHRSRIGALLDGPGGNGVAEPAGGERRNARCLAGRDDRHAVLLSAKGAPLQEPLPSLQDFSGHGSAQQLAALRLRAHQHARDSLGIAPVQLHAALLRETDQLGDVPAGPGLHVHPVAPVRSKVLSRQEVMLPGNHLHALPLLGPRLGHHQRLERRILVHREQVLLLPQPGVDALEDRDPMGTVTAALQRGLDVIHEAGLPQVEPLELVRPPREIPLLLLQPLTGVLLHVPVPDQELFGQGRVKVDGRFMRSPSRVVPELSPHFVQAGQEAVGWSVSAMGRVARTLLDG